MGKWQFWIDRGGTFTDVIAIDPTGCVHTQKLLSVAPEKYEDAAMFGIRTFLGLPSTAPFPTDDVLVVKMGTTVATNALLERNGEKVVFLTTEGFGDALRIGYQNRPDIFAKHIQLPDVLYEQVIEVPERILADGTVARELDEDLSEKRLRDAYAEGFRACAIALMHGYRFPAHETKITALAKKVGFTQISASHQVSPLQKLISRGNTCVADAYLTPVLQRYIAQLQHELADTRLYFMQSHGGLATSARFRGKDSILSGPAGGVIGAAHAAKQAGYERAIAFDMGGTSTDVSLINGEPMRDVDNEIAGIRLHIPMLQIETVAAGGGSILRFEHGRCQVGPESSGAHPGPTAYGLGGPLSLSDCHVLLGRLQPDHFPAIFGKDGDAPLAKEAVKDAFGRLTEKINNETHAEHTPEEIAEGFLRIGVENMANAIKRISLHRGHDPRDFVLVCFGGAGGQHACRVADSLGIRTVLLHPLAGVLSAFGMGCAAQRVLKSRTIEGPFTESLRPFLQKITNTLLGEALGEMSQDARARDDSRVNLCFELRYEGSDSIFPVNVAERFDDVDWNDIATSFHNAHKQCFGFHQPKRNLILARLSVETVIAEPPPKESAARNHDEDVGPEASPSTVHAYMAGKWRHVPLYRREDLCLSHSIVGPAIVQEKSATTLIEPGWQGKIDPHHNLVLQSDNAEKQIEKVSDDVDPVILEVFHNAFMSVAEQMGATLARSAHSVNIKERLDFSCALFDGKGNLVANAPHVPVHLGSMGQAVQHILNHNADMAPGDAFAINAPYQGGTHLPDITVVSPIFNAAGDERLGFVASRGHHADIGGIAPGSMPADSIHIDEEGVLFDNFRLMSRRDFHAEAFLNALRNARHPARNPEQNLADIQAQLAANETGIREFRKLIQQHGQPVVKSYMGHVQDHAEETLRSVVRTLRDGSCIHTLDSGAEIHVEVRVNQTERSVHIDFSGTSPVQPNNLNAPRSVCIAAVLYVFRTLIDEDIPLNAGFLRPLHIHIPPSSMLDPRHPAAVVAGNVETSQAITEAIYRALGVMAGSQGTMNNFIFGNEAYQYYETLGGGAGAGPNFPGASAVHTHMTNSRLTDPEVLEARFPVVLETFAIRRNSGGGGRYAGGDGMVRKIRFLTKMKASILSNQRVRGPFGAEGGENGLPGVNRHESAAGITTVLPSNASFEVLANDAIEILTPGGGGYGKRE